MQQIVITSDANQEFTTLLNGVQYKINLWWSDVAKRWYISIFDSQGNAIVQGSRVMVRFPVIGQLLTDFVGDLYAIPVADETNSIGRNDWGVAYNFYYLTPNEIASIGS